MINQEWLEAFVVFAEHLNLTRAAEARHLTQPALFVHLRKLAEALDTPLYRRNGRALELTAGGERVLAFGREMRERSGRFLDELHGGGSPQSVVLVGGEGAYLYLLGGAIRDFLAHGSAPLRLLTRDRDGTVSALLRGEAQLGVTTLDVLPDGIEAEELTAVDQVAVLPRRHRLAKKRSLRLADLDGEKLLLPPPDRPHRQAVARALLSANVKAEVAVEAAGWELLLHFARLGLGVAIVNGCCRVPAGFVARPLPELPRLRYYLAHRRQTPLAPAALELRKTLRAHARDWQSA